MSDDQSRAAALWAQDSPRWKSCFLKPGQGWKSYLLAERFRCPYTKAIEYSLSHSVVAAGGALWQPTVSCSVYAGWM